MELDHSLIDRLVDSWLAEDVGRGDATSAAIAPNRSLTARLEAREALIVAGIEVARSCFERSGRVSWGALVKDGERVAAGTTLARVEGPLEVVLSAERTALNILGRLSGIATMTGEFVAALDGTGVRVADTRKTTPGLRVVEKYAVAVGGGTNHRFGLDDGILIKDNHVAAAGGVAQAIRSARRNAPFGLKVEVEVSNQTELTAALEEGPDIILLDNLTPDAVRAAVTEIAGRSMVEVSGGISLENIRDYAIPGVDLISVGALTHSAPTSDVALEVES